MKLIVLSSPEEIPQEAHILNQLFAEGMEFFHLRKPAYAQAQVEALLSQIAPAHYPKIALHHFHPGAERFGIKRMHYPERHRAQTSLPEWEAQRAQGRRLSTSVHDVETLQHLPSCFDYAFFSPVFTSISKPGYAAVLPPDFYLTEPVKAVPVIALGGVEAGTIAQVRKMNFDGAAVLGAIWKNPLKAVASFIDLQKECR